MGVKELREAWSFACTAQFWRMAILWTLSLIFSYVQLFFGSKTSTKKQYVRCSPSVYTSRVVRKPICIITGATSGLGAAAARALSKEGFYVVLVGRSPDLLSKTISDIKKWNTGACAKAFQVDLSSYQSILKFRNSLEQWLQDSDMHSSVQLLINNAGILATSQRMTCSGYDKMMATNYIGAFCLTKVLLPLLEKSPVPSRIVNITSFTHRTVSGIQLDRGIVTGEYFSKLKTYPYAQIYECSKLCVLLLSYELHQQLGLCEGSHRVSVIAVDPGAVKTNIMREIPDYLSRMAFFALGLLGLLQSPETAVCSILDAVLAPPETTGVYFFGGNGRILTSSALSYSPKLAKDLWVTSCHLFLELKEAFKDTMHTG